MDLPGIPCAVSSTCVVSLPMRTIPKRLESLFNNFPRFEICLFSIRTMKVYGYSMTLLKILINEYYLMILTLSQVE
jgi:hypothetical protein